MTQKSWVEKHRPETFDDIQGNNKALEEIEDWIDGWERGDDPVLLVGDPGTGKTTTAYVAADSAGLDLNQINASSARKSDDVKRMVQQMRSGDQLILLDECDSYHHAVDLSPLSAELSDPSNPVILTANSEYDVPESIKGPSETYEFKLSIDSRRAKIEDIAQAENIPLDPEDLQKLAERPDLRSAINDLQLHARSGVPIGDDEREWDGSEFSAMDAILQYENASDVDVRPPWLVMWLDQNARKQLSGLEAAAAYDALSRADTYVGSSGGGDYRGWRYAGLLAESVADLHLTEPYTGWMRWEFPSWVQSSMPDPDDESPEAALYRDLRVTGSYATFRGCVLPVLDRLPETEKWELVIHEGISQTAAEAIGVGEGKYETLTVREAAEAGEELDAPAGDAMEGDW